jgi:hypothetical protein
MKAMHSAPPEKAWRIGKGPFIFSGMPPACTGKLELINISDKKVKIRTIPTVQNKDNSVLTAVHLVASIPPGECVQIPAHFQITTNTPAGTYKTSLSCGKQREDVVVYVFDNYNFSINPQSIFLRGAAGETLSHPMVINNTGNVELQLPAVSLVWFEEQDWVGRTFVYSLRESSKAEGYEKYLDRVMEEFHSEMIPSTRVHIKCKPDQIKPGIVAEVLLTITLPKKLKKDEPIWAL